jgi:hypothetical protein
MKMSTVILAGTLAINIALVAVLPGRRPEPVDSATAASAASAANQAAAGQSGSGRAAIVQSRSGFPCGYKKSRRGKSAAARGKFGGNQETCPETSLVISNMLTLPLPLKTALSLSSALI